jgi:hypothetical protein
MNIGINCPRGVYDWLLHLSEIKMQYNSVGWPASVVTSTFCFPWFICEIYSVDHISSKCSAFYIYWRFIKCSQELAARTLPWTRLIQYSPAHCISLRLILMLFPHLCLGLPGGSLPFWFSGKSVMCNAHMVFAFWTMLLTLRNWWFHWCLLL